MDKIIVEKIVSSWNEFGVNTWYFRWRFKNSSQWYVYDEKNWENFVWNSICQGRNKHINLGIFLLILEFLEKKRVF